MPSPGFTDRSLSALLTTIGMCLLPSAALLATSIGPAARVTFRPYLPIEPIALAGFGMLLGAALGAEASLVAPLRALRERPALHSALRLVVGSVLGGLAGLFVLSASVILVGDRVAHPVLLLGPLSLLVPLAAFAGALLLYREVPPARNRRLIRRVELLALAGLAAWVIAPQLTAFPASGSIAARERWAMENVREYPGLVRVVTALPDIQRDVGSIEHIAPTAADPHVYAREMNGDDLRFTLDVEGTLGRGVLAVDCTIGGDRVIVWHSAQWRFGGQVIAIERPPVGMTFPP